jgi:hypothetical protein
MENVWQLVQEALEEKGCTDVARISEDEIGFITPGGVEYVLTLDSV